MNFIENISLRSFNTFHIDARARYFAAFASVEQLDELLAAKMSRRGREDALILGGGSNMLLTRDLDGYVLKNEISGIQLLHEDADHIYVKAGAGENWHGFVQYCIQHNWAGLENLSLIPGTVGASPIQNIGAYGVELQDVFLSLEAFHINERKPVTLTAADCRFGYRSSTFKTDHKGKFIITSVSFRLNKKPIFHTSYGAIGQELEKMGINELSIQSISDAVIRIRTSKLPDPARVGNAGSFFKNPEVSADTFNALKDRYPELVGHALPNGKVKLAAGWLIEHCGPAPGISWKGYRKGDAGVHDKQALVLVNHGQARGEELLSLSTEIIQTVKAAFGVELEREVNIIR